MKFVDRKEELRELQELHALSQKKLFLIAIYGLRRVGKTRLLLEFMKGKGLYFFVNRNKTSADLLAEYERILKKHGIIGELETITNWDIFMETLIQRSPQVVVFDEFQNFRNVEPAMAGILQKTVDLNENRPGLVVLTGSLIGLMKDTFQNSKEPLYGRIKRSKKLEPLTLKACLGMSDELKIKKEEFVKLFGIFGGYPKYYVTIEDYALQGKTAEEAIDTLLLRRDAPLEKEVISILSQEFGGRSGIYYSILEAIAKGNNTLAAIAGYLNMPSASITRQLGELKDYFEIVEYEMPFKGKRGVYRIRHPFMEFWFGAIYRNYSDYLARNPDFIGMFRKNLNAAFGRTFERTALEFVSTKLKLKKAKRQWGRIANIEKSRETYEIDCIGISDKETVAFEFKWKELDIPESIRILKKLKEKLAHVKGLPAETQTGLVAKKIKGKTKLRNMGFPAYDIDDF